MAGLNHLKQLSERQKADFAVRKQRRLFTKLPLYLTKGNKQTPATHPSTESERKPSHTLFRGSNFRTDMRMLLPFILALGITMLIILTIIKWLSH